MGIDFSTMSVLTKFLHLNHLFLSKRIKEIDPALSKPHAGIIIHMLPDTPYKVGELAKMLDVTPGAITQATKPLIKEGYLLRENGEDLRTVYLKLTKKGVDLRGKILNEFKKLNNTMLDFLTDNEKKIFLSLLQKITDELEKRIEDYD
ncbi:MarR family transcriptional regulator [Thermotomaculum hydrothermale]|uniref:MarR family transcriptional regulator n=1 Tax=Thermotomaculum hydrothermale TaxID=981385 RepID=A0A7R6PTA0_9BACT|nr:hypothetical protein [Thermotomaculum hydrothermale]BBB32232.1 MarR family transcriptional regulator [Thermotomaculum hydrothermale]